MKVQLFNALQNQMAEAEMSVVGNEFHATFLWEAPGLINSFDESGEPILNGDGTPVLIKGIVMKTHVVKFPKVETSAELKALIDKHNAANGPKVLAEEVEAQNAEMNDILSAL